MKKNSLFGLILVLCLILSIFSYFRISSLKKEIAQLNTKISDLQDSENELLRNVMIEVDSRLEEFHHILVDAEYSFENYEFDEDNLKVKMHVEVLPKTADSERTRVYLTDGNSRTYDLELKGNRYEGTIETGLFDTLYVDHVTLQTEGIQKNQKLGWVIEPYSEIMTNIQLSYDGNVYVKGKEKMKVETDPTVSVDIFSNGLYNVDLKQAEMVVELNGEEIDRIPFEDTYSDEVSAHSVLMSKKDSYDIHPGDQMMFYVDIQEGDFEFRRLLEDVTLNTDGERIYNEQLEIHRITENIRIRYKDKIIYDLSDKLK